MKQFCKKVEATCLLSNPSAYSIYKQVKYKKIINSEYYHRHCNGYYCLQTHIHWLDFLVYCYTHGIENNTSRYSRDDRYHYLHY